MPPEHLRRHADGHEQPQGGKRRPQWHNRFYPLAEVENAEVTEAKEYSNAMCRWDRRILALKVAIDTCAAVRGGR